MGSTQSDFAKNLGWSFIQTYYNIFSTKPSETYKLYSPNALVSHDDLNKFLLSEVPEHEDIVANGTDEIKAKIFASHSPENPVKVMVSQADMQTLNIAKDCKTIMIVVMGEVAKGDSAAFGFVQTFIINPSAKNSNVYDITNDILRFSPLEDAHENESVDEEEEEEEEEISSTAATSTTSTPVKLEKELKDEEPEKSEGVEEAGEESNGELKEPEEEAKKEEAVEEEPEKNEEKREKKKQEKKPEKEEAKSQEPKKETKKELKEKPKAAEEEVKAPAAPTSWAARVAKNTVVEPKNEPKPELKTEAKKGESKGESKGEAKPKPAVVNGKPEIETDGFDVVKTKKVKKPSREEFYPIYIRGLSQKITEKELVDELELRYGKVNACTIKSYVALVDFKNGKGQELALKAKSVNIAGKLEVSLEPRTKKDDKKKEKANGKKFVNRKNGPKAGVKKKEKE